MKEKSQIKNQKKSDYFIGLDIGTNSVGYAATTENYELVKYQQHPVWGVHLFDEAHLADERRIFRSGRRRLDRRQQRVQLLRELFALAIKDVDPKFFQRIDSSSLKKESTQLPRGIFVDTNYTDSIFYAQYPTIHHLISELTESTETHDVRLVYLACAWLLVHRGHFFSDVDKEKVDEITNFSMIYRDLENFVEEHGYTFPWKHVVTDSEAIGLILKTSNSKTDKLKKLTEFLQVRKTKKREIEDEQQWFDEIEFLKLLCGSKGKTTKLFPTSEYVEFELALDADEDKIAVMLSELNEDDASLLLFMKKIYDWTILADIIGKGKNISSSKVQIYEKHKTDLKLLKYIVKKYLSHQDYLEIFRSSDKSNYAAYSGSGKQKKVNREDFYKFLNGKLKKIVCNDIEDQNIILQIIQDIAAECFLPKQVTTDNRTIPYQLYWNELNNILNRASVYLTFLQERDEDGLSVQDKILSIMEFRVPYFVGPLNAHSKFSWFKRKAEGAIRPWNFDKKVDLDASEEAFIKRMTNRCTYLPCEPALPKQSLLYQRFEVLNLINNLQINGMPISVTCKQALYKLFRKVSKVNKRMILAFFKANNIYCDIDVNSITGIDETVTAALTSWKFFYPFLESKKLTVDDVEQIINKSSFTEDSSRFTAYLKSYSSLSTGDVKKIASKKFQGFGRLSRKFLTEPIYIDPQTGNKLSIINMMWDYNLNLQQLLSEKYPFRKMIEDAKKQYYASNPASLVDRLDAMYVSNAVKRPIIRALTIVDEITKTLGHAPSKIFVEMARDVTDGAKKQRTVSRLGQLKALYQKIADEDIRLLAKELEKYDESSLQKDTLYLYFMQLGRDMYTGEAITDLSLYDKEHIYPRSKVKDDSILNNIVLVRSELNGEKTNIYPIDSKIRNKMIPFWQGLLKKGLITSEKYFRLTRSTPFSEDEKWGFINRQLVETRQSTKVITELLKERYPSSEIVYVKAGLISDFRHEYDLVKSRTVNDLHHGKDAYLNIVVGNVYHGYFTRNWFLENTGDYSIKLKTLFAFPRKDCSGKYLWNGAEEIGQIKKTVQRNYLHMTNYTFTQKGGFFDQNPLAASPGLIPLKKGKTTELYGGYNKAAATFFIFVLTNEIKGKKSKKELTLVPIDLMTSDKFLKDDAFQISYIKHFMDPAGKKDFSIEFPFGLKPIKIKTVFEVDNGLRFRLNGKASGGSTLLIALFTPLLLDRRWEMYIKRLESFSEKKRKNPQLLYSEKYDHFSVQENIELYDILLSKLEHGPFSKRPASPVECLKNGKDAFSALTPEKQAEILLGLVNSFGTSSGAGVNLTDIGGVAKAAVTTLSSKLSNWKNIFKTACIVYSDSSGLHETKSCNLLELI